MLNKLSRSRVFATNVKKAWHLGKCGEDVLIIFSVRENVVSTTVKFRCSLVNVVTFIKLSCDKLSAVTLLISSVASATVMMFKVKPNNADVY